MNTSPTKQCCINCSYHNDDGTITCVTITCECHTQKASEDNLPAGWREKISELHNRFKCAACDGAKCLHTQACQVLTALEEPND